MEYFHMHLRICVSPTQTQLHHQGVYWSCEPSVFICCFFKELFCSHHNRLIRTAHVAPGCKRWTSCCPGMNRWPVKVCACLSPSDPAGISPVTPIRSPDAAVNTRRINRPHLHRSSFNWYNSLSEQAELLHSFTSCCLWGTRGDRKGMVSLYCVAIATVTQMV